MREFRGFGILSTNLAISDAVARTLVMKSVELILKKKNKIKVQGDFIDGELGTEGECYHVGIISGQKFSGEFDIEKGHLIVSFLLNYRFFNPEEHSFWGGVVGQA